MPFVGQLGRDEVGVACGNVAYWVVLSLLLPGASLPYAAVPVQLCIELELLLHNERCSVRNKRTRPWCMCLSLSPHAGCVLPVLLTQGRAICGTI